MSRQNDRTERDGFEARNARHGDRARANGDTVRGAIEAPGEHQVASAACEGEVRQSGRHARSSITPRAGAGEKNRRTPFEAIDGAALQARDA